MARSKLYDKPRGEGRDAEAKEPPVEETGRSGPTEKGEEPATAEKVVGSHGDMAARHAEDRNALHQKHESERRDLHGKHRAEHRQLHEMHEKQMQEVMK